MKMNITIGRKMASGMGLLISLLLASIVIAGIQHMSGPKQKRTAHNNLDRLNLNKTPYRGNACVAQRPGPGRETRLLMIDRRQTVWL